MVRWASNIFYPIRSRRTKWPADEFERVARLWLKMRALIGLRMLVCLPVILPCVVLALIGLCCTKIADAGGELCDRALNQAIFKARHAAYTANQVNGKKHGWGREYA
jgi:hypothetical protein